MAESRRGRRFFKLARMSASVAASSAADRVSSLFKSKEDAERDRQKVSARAGERIAATLGELKGAAMKLGQMASMARDVLPPQLADALTGLQKDAPPMPFEVIREQIERELGSPPEMLFDRFDEEPFAAASIGQVHRAKTDDGREVVCKVQYPGVDKSVDSDLAQLKFAFRSAGLLRVPKKALDGIFEEIRITLKEELDYTNEAENVRLFQRLHADDDFIVIPDVVGERSSGRVLTLEYEQGETLAAAAADPRYTQEVRDLLGERFYRMVYKQYWQCAALHLDPNPANFAVRPDGTIVIYDFGAIKRFPESHLRNHRNLVVTALAHDDAGMEKALIDLGIRVPGTDPVPSFYPAMSKFLEDIRDAGPIAHGESGLHNDFLDLAKILLRYPRRFQPSRYLTLFDRVHTGHYTNVRTLQATVPIFGIFEEFFALPQLGDEGYVPRFD